MTSNYTMSAKPVFLLIPIFLWICATLHAQVRDIHFDHITINEGLSQSTVQAIQQDAHGHMWFGTNDGLNKYNGYDFTIYRFNPSDQHSISDHNIRSLYLDSQDRLWIGTQSGGLNMYDSYLDHFVRYLGSDDQAQYQTLSDNTVWTILEDHEGLFWVGTGYGLNLMNREQGSFHRIYSVPEDSTSLTHNHITTLYQDYQGDMWIGTADGFNKLDREKGEFIQYKTFRTGEPEQPLGMIRAIYEDAQGAFWIGTENRGLFIFDRKAETFTRFIHSPADPFSISGNSVFSILEDSQQRLWIGTGNEGLNIFDRETGSFKRFQYHPDIHYSINNNGILTLFESRENIVWIGTFAGGINFTELKKERFSHFYNEPQIPNSLSHNVVQSVYQGSDGFVWIGTDGGGLNRFDPETGTIQRVTRQTEWIRSPESNVILDIHETDHGLWLATYGNGIELLPADNREYINYRHQSANPGSLSSDYVFGIYETNDGHLWFSTNWGGINVLNPGTGIFRHYSINPEDLDDPATIRNNDTRMVFEDSSGDIWIGTYQNNLSRINRRTGFFTHYNLNETSIYNTSVAQAIHEDRFNRLWIGTRGAGLMYFDRESDRPLPFATIDNGLPSNVIHAIVEDDHGHLWLSTNNGITRLDTETLEFTNYSIEQGLGQREFNPGAGFKDKTGYIYFGGVNGFNRFHPDSLRQDYRTYPVILTGLLLFNEPLVPGDASPIDVHISLADHIQLPHNSSVISFEYAALDFRANKGTRYSYMLDGFDENWIDAGTRRIATYTNLKPGDYVFKVRSDNLDGIWNENLAAVSIRIIPPFWRSSWFIGLMIVLLTASISGIYRHRVYQIRTQNIRLEKKVRVRTEELRKSNETKNKLFSIISHDLRNFASGFVGFTGLVYESARDGNLKEVVEYSDYLQNAANQFTDFLKNLLEWARTQLDEIQYNPGEIDVESFVRGIVSTIKPAALNKQIEIKTIIEHGLQVFADRDLLGIVLHNLLNNAVKFSNANSEVVLTAAPEKNGFVKFTILDNGVGMNNETIRILMSPDEFITSRGTAGEKGTGLGFSICKNLISKNKGIILISSTVGKGTSVQFTVPASNTHTIHKASLLL
jgi:two-component system, sensor histidine kinase ChiS